MIRYLLEIYEEIDSDVIINRFSSAVRSPIDGTNSTYPDSIGNPIRYPVKLAIPKLMTKLSDSISGAIILSQFSLMIANHDGKYDDVQALGWFNVPAVVKRADKDNPTLDDFTQIFSGIIDYPVVSEASVKLVINNVYRSLTGEATNTFNDTDYPDIPDNTKDRDVPIGYGPGLTNVILFEIDKNDDTKYIAIDPDYITAVNAVYDKDGVSIAFVLGIDGVITATDARTADVEGVAGNTIGDIITSEITLKTSITYTADNWDIVETNEYVNDSGNLNFYFPGGTVRQLVDAVLKSDNAFLYTKNDGLLTIRQWGRSYKVHEIKSGRIMRFPTKDYRNALTYYNSLAVIKYDKNQSLGIYEKQIASGTTPSFNKPRKIDYPTDLYIEGQIVDLGTRMIKRFGEISEDMNLSSGTKTIDINLLDQVNIEFNINGRIFSDKTKWIVRSVDPGQDILGLEAKSGFVISVGLDGVLSQALTVYNGDGYDGILSQPLSVFNSDTYDGVLSQPPIVTGEEL